MGRRLFGDSNLIMQKVRGDKCLDIIKLVDTFGIKQIPRE
jgi:hypothetical protein